MSRELEKSHHIQANIDKTVAWLKANPKIAERSIQALKLGRACPCDALALHPQLLLKVATGTFRSAAAAKAPKEVLQTLKTRRDLVRKGLDRLPKFAYSWLSVAQLGDIKSKAKARSLITAAAARAPDAANKKALKQLAESFAARPGGGGSSLPCLLCCAIGCLECGPFCVICCIIGCLICLIAY
jgi:hypothetical protein